jgi:hypothetical protein
MPNVRVSNPRGNSVSINRQGTVKNIKTVAVPATTTSSAASNLSQLQDVDTSGAANNEVLVYNEVTGKYEVKEITIVDGGIF